jgi:hypothetical protein
MPTYGDETLRDRYAREHADHMARLAKMTPEQIAEIELDLHNALAERDSALKHVEKMRDLLAAWRRMFDGGICSGTLGALCDQTDAALSTNK